MLRIHVLPLDESVRLRLEGKLVHPWVDELVKVWMGLVSARPKPALIEVDLSDVSYVDGCGRALLAAMGKEGCVLMGTGPFIAAMIQDLQARTGK